MSSGTGMGEVAGGVSAEGTTGAAYATGKTLK
jgi:hypothetical protein